MNGRAAALAAFVACLAAPAAMAAELIEDIRIVRRGSEATVTIALACPMRIESDLATEGGWVVELSVAPTGACGGAGIGSGIFSEAHRPVGGQLAYLREVELESLGVGDGLLLLHFDRPVEHRVEQGGNLRALTLTIGEAGTELPGAPATPAMEAAPSVPAARTSDRIDRPLAPTSGAAERAAESSGATARSAPAPDRRPLSVTVSTPRVAADYVVNLQSTRELPAADVVASVAVPDGRKLYVSELAVNGATWFRLRLGFFDDEPAARAVLDALAGRFPRGWVGRAEPDEIANAVGYAFDPGAVVHAARPIDEIAPVDAPADAVAVDAAEIEARMAEAREQLRDGDFDAAVGSYTALLQAPGEHRPEAREYLGVAREKNGQLAHARAEYEAYLRDYPSAEGSARVRQRLNGLVLAGQAPREALRAANDAGRGSWDVGTGVSQYYRRNENRFGEDEARVVTFSGLFTDFDLSVRHSGSRLDTFGRVAVSHLYDMLDAGVDQNRYSYAYFDVHDVKTNWSLRVGRQTLHGAGVLGRFDGAHFAYEWAPDRRVHYTTGHPVESTRDSVETHRRFNGVAVDFDRLVGDWDLSAFVTQQTIESVNDRSAAGLEARYADERRTFTGLFDYDVEYGQVNMALALGTWRLPRQLTLSALVDMRASPILTTRNALIGQPVTTIEELLLVWTEDEIRQLAEDRTSRSTTVTLGVAAPLGQRFQVNADVTSTEYGATVESGGVLAVPGTGRQTYLSTSFVGSGLIGTGDVTILTFRHGRSPAFETNQITWDARFPLGHRLRLNPRLRYVTWRGLADSRTRESVSPSLRLLLSTRRHLRLEAELGADRFVRTDANGERESSGYFFNLGYRADFQAW